MKIALKRMLPIFVALFAAAFVSACSGDGGSTDETDKVLRVEEKRIDPPAEGGEYTLHVTSENVPDWDYRADDTWIECTSAAGSGIITVKVFPNDSEEPRSSRIVVFADGVEDAVVTVTQAGDAGSGGFEPTPDAPIIWDNNGRFFAKLSGPAYSVDFVEDMPYIQLVEFDEAGYVKSITTDVEGGELVTTYEYDEQNRLSRIGFFNSAGQGIGMSMVVNYTTEHDNYVEFGHAFLGGLEFVKAFQPRFLKGVSSVVTTTLGSGSYEVKYLFSGHDLTVEDSNGNVLGNATYGDDGFIDSQTNYMSTKQGDAEYYVDFHETYDIDSRTGKYRTITYVENWTPVDPESGTAYTTEPYTETYYDDRYNNLHMEGTSVEYTYTEFGEFLLITSPMGTDSYSYTRDEHDNWTQRVDNSRFMEEDYVFTDDRTVEYYGIR